MNSQNLKILMVAPQPFFRARGTPFSVLHRIRALAGQGNTVDLVTYPFGEDVDLPGLNIIRASTPPLVNDVRIGPSLAKLALDVPLYRKTSELLKNNEYDIIHSHEEAAFFCVGLAKRYGLPHIYDMHSSLPQQLANFGKFNFSPVHTLFEWLEDRVLTSCDGVITICDDLAEIAREKCPNTPHSMIENTADDRMVFPAADSDVRRELRLEDKEIVLYTGTFEAYQGLDLLKDSFSQVAESRANAHLLLVGGRPEQVDEFERSIQGSTLQNRVTLVGTVHPSMIPGYINAADLIVSPRSSGTNTPLKIYGYMRTGKPIVATDRWTHTQILKPNMAELVPATVEGLAQGMKDILEDRQRGEALAASARAFADREFSDEAYVRKVLGLYQEVFARLPGSRSVYIKSAH